MKSSLSLHYTLVILTSLIIGLLDQKSFARRLQKGNRPHQRRILKHRRTTKSKLLENPIPLEQQLPIAVIIYAHNNTPYIKKNIESVFTQDYHHYRIIYIQDACDDGSIELLQQLLHSHTLANKVSSIVHINPQGKLAALHSAIHTCNDEEIIVLLDGRDWFADKWTLTTIARAYINNDIWLTYGSCAPEPKDYTIGIRTAPVPEDIIEKGYFRKVFPFMPTQSFYAWLFKQIKQEDLIDPATGNFFKHACECHIMWPLLEMAHKRFGYLKPITYIINCHDPITRLEEDYYLRIACNSQMGKALPIYQVVEKSILNNS